MPPTSSQPTRGVALDLDAGTYAERIPQGRADLSEYLWKMSQATGGRRVAFEGDGAIGYDAAGADVLKDVTPGMRPSCRRRSRSKAVAAAEVPRC